MNNKMNNRIDISVVGFYGSGSSAVIDLLREYENVGVALDRNQKGVLRPYEHFLFVSSGGLFELGALITQVNSAYGSDHFFNRFIQCTERLYYNDFSSFGSLKWLLGEEFMESTREFLKALGVKEEKNANTEHMLRVRFSIIRCILQLAAKIVYHRPVYKWGKKVVKDGRKDLFGMPTEEQFYTSAQKYVKRYLDMCDKNKDEFLIFDQLICPQHTSIIHHYFDTDTYKVIAVERDPRDIYTASKYVMSKPPYGFNPPLPINYDDFADYWKKNLNYDRNIENLLIIQFEDLVYKYEETKKRIESFIGLKTEDHIRPLKYFDPSKSIKNTQTFHVNDDTEVDGKEIGKRLVDYLYDFPYDIKPNFSEMFDDTAETQ